MLSILFWAAIIIVGIPIALIVAWNFIKLFFALISDVAGIIFAFILFGIIAVCIQLII